ncbi:MAG: hypothetical protein LBP62_06780 [Clostridiales bacterium]|jgi:hypothetical protein|nr:hypothetical protein [Clostridiales bacterium]
MIITAHGGALNTGRNGVKFFETIKNYPVDAVEVDVRQKGGELYISHMPPLFLKKILPLSFVFEFIKENGFKVNCDMKRGGTAGAVFLAAQKAGAQDRLIFTGRVERDDLEELRGSAEFLRAKERGVSGRVERGDLKELRGAAVYLDPKFFGFSIDGNLGRVKDEIEKLNCPFVKGININYRRCGESVLVEAEKYGVGLSVYTVDDAAELRRLTGRAAVENITTNIPDEAIKIYAEKGGTIPRKTR